MKCVTDAWYRPGSWITIFSPLSRIFEKIVRRRRDKFLATRSTLDRPDIPIVIIGNISVGGTGKSPLVTHLIDWLRSEGVRPGIISRGYGGKAPAYPYQVTMESLPEHCGDEPLMIFKRSQCPIVVDPNRLAAAKALAATGEVDVILADDGLQHYRLERDLEIVVMDAKRMFGNGLCLPAGPLREPPDRLDSVDLLILNGKLVEGQANPHPNTHNMILSPDKWIRSDQSAIAAKDFPFKGKKVHAIAGIGNPERFFITLEEMGLEVIPHPFADHHPFKAEDLQFEDDYPILLTEKDAVKCHDFWPENAWALTVAPKLDEAFYTGFLNRIRLIERQLSS